MAAALYLNGMRAIIRGKHAKAGALHGLDTDLAHNWVIFHGEDGFSVFFSGRVTGFHLEQLEVAFSEPDGGCPPELEVSFPGGYEF